MNKKQLFLNNLFVFIATIIIFAASLMAIYFTLKINEEKTLMSYGDDINFRISNTIDNKYNSVIDEYRVHKELELSFFSEGDLIPKFDTSSSPKTEENFNIIKENVNKVYYSYSKTLEKDMFYYVVFNSSSSLYLRVGTGLDDSIKVVMTTSYIGLPVVAIVDLVYFFFTWRIFKKSVKNLKTQVKKLHDLTDSNQIIEYDDDLRGLTKIVHDTRKELEEQLKINYIGEQKLNFILDSISQGLVVINAKNEVIMFNKKARDIFKIGEITRNKIDIIHAKTFEKIGKNMQIVLKTSRPMIYDVEIEGRVYECDINIVNYSFAKVDEKQSVSLLMIDVTEEFNSSKMKREFFANASHELKSPLTSVIGYQELIRDGLITDPNELKLANLKTIKEANRMKKLLMEMLELSALENNDLRPIEKINVMESLDSIIDSLEPQIKQRELSVVKNYDNFIIKMFPGDFDKLYRNLIENAIKYNKVGGKIEVTINNIDNSISIKDEGIGILVDDQQRIFERFYRVDKARSRENGGTGLGLSIVKYICNYYNFEIIIDSKIGKGSKFTVKSKI